MSELGTVRGQVILDIRQAVAAYATLRAQNAKLTYALRGTGDSFVAAGKRMTLAGAGLLYVFGKAVSASAEFERKLDFFGAVTNTTSKQMDTLSKFTLQLAQDTIYSAGQVADGFIELAKAGITAKEIIGGVGQAVTSLGAAADIPLVQSGQIIVSTMRQFHLSAKDAVKITNELAGAANASLADIEDIGVSLKYVGGVAHVAGLGLDDVSTALAILAQNGIRGSTAGTSLRQMIVSLGGATKPAKDALKELGIITEDGSNKFYDQQGRLKSLRQVYQILQNATKGLTAQQKVATFRTIFNNRALSAAAILTSAGSKGFRKMAAEIAKTDANEVAHKRLDNLSGDIEILRGNIETLLVRAGSPFQKMLRGWVQNITKLVQAFGKLPESTQKTIVQTIAITGAALVAMGVFNIIIGTIFKFVASLLKLAAGMKFLFKILRIVVFNLRFAATVFRGPLIAAVTALAGALGITVGVLLAIIAAIVAVVVALVVLYKKWKPFHDLVNKTAKVLWEAVKALGAFFKALVTDPGKAWAMLKKGFSQLGKWAKQVGELIAEGFKKGLQAVKNFAVGAVQWFLSLPGKAIGALMSFVKKITELFTFRNIGFALGYLLGTVLRFFIELSVKMITLSQTAVSKVIGFFSQLPGKIGYLVGFMVGKVLGFLIKLQIRAWMLAGKIVLGIIKFFAKLPGRVAKFFGSMAGKLFSALRSMIVYAIKHTPEVIEAVLKFFRNLPENLGKLMVKTIQKLKNFVVRAISVGVEIGSGFYNGLVNLIANLPDLIGSILGRVIDVFKDLILAGFNAAKDFAGGLWNGFKSGLGINSPSFIEKHMVQMTKTVDDETKKLARQTMHIQKLGKNITKAKFGVEFAPALSTLSSTARMGQFITQQTTTPVAAPVTITNVPATNDRAQVHIDTVEINNPKPERGSESIKKAIRNRAFEAGWN